LRNLFMCGDPVSGKALALVLRGQDYKTRCLWYSCSHLGVKDAELEGAIFSMGYLSDAIQRYFADPGLDGSSLDYVE
jgi:hypothetical protein